jgi:hypothetical protein
LKVLVFDYVPRPSTEVARFCHPMPTPDGDEGTVDAAAGGACGEAWQPAGPH